MTAILAPPVRFRPMHSTATEIAAAVRAGELTARAATEAALARIAERDAAHRRLPGGPRRGRAARGRRASTSAPTGSALPLAGVPIAIKDNVAGQRRADAHRLAGQRPDAPTSSTTRSCAGCAAAGAVVVGLTRVPELCVFGATDSDVRHHPQPVAARRAPRAARPAARRPRSRPAWCRSRTATTAWARSASRPPAAGWSASSPASGVVPSELGNGSWFDMAENGPLATTVADCALLLSVLADRPELAEVAEPGALRIAVSTRSPDAGAAGATGSWAEAAAAAGALLREAGHTVRQAEPAVRPAAAGRPRSPAGWPAPSWTPRARRDRSRARAPHPPARRGSAGWCCAPGCPRDTGRQRWQRAAERFFADHDVLITPALAQSPLARGRRGRSAAGWPTCSPTSATRRSPRRGTSPAGRR